MTRDERFGIAASVPKVGRPAFSFFLHLPRYSALRAYEHRVTGFTDDLISQLNSHSGEPVNASRWMNYYAFDMMGDMAFGKSFDMLKTGEKVFFFFSKPTGEISAADIH
jgi:hypothetical protein